MTSVLRGSSMRVGRERRTRPIPAKSLTTAIVFGNDADAGVEIEAFMLDSTSFSNWSIRVDAYSFSCELGRAGIRRERAHRPSLRRNCRASFDRG